MTHCAAWVAKWSIEKWGKIKKRSLVKVKQLMLLLEGAHGTTSHRASIIKLNGFQATKGRGGTGAYFWQKALYSKVLALGWCAHRKARGHYRSDKNESCVVIYAKLHVQNEAYLNFEDQTLKDKIAMLAQKMGIGRDNNKLAALFDFFVAELEREQDVQYRVIYIRVAPPPKEYCPDYWIEISGAPPCYVARDVACIEIDRVEEDV